MRIFITLIDQSGVKRTTRININNCINTSILIKQICKEIKLNKSNVIIKIKYQPYNLRLIDNWPLEHYPIKNGSTFIIEYNQSKSRKQSIDSPESLQKIEEDINDQFQQQTPNQLSFLGNTQDNKYSSYFEQCLNRMLQAVRNQSLQQTSKILNQLPDCKDDEDIDRIMNKKLKYLLNQSGDCGRNALHWAIHLNNPDIVSFLIIKGANPTTLTIDHYTPLQLAVQHRSTQIIKILLDQRSIDINQVTKRGTALDLVVLNQDIKCLQLLLKNGVDIQTINIQGKTSIQLCKNKQIKNILQKRSQIKRLPLPNISKGQIYKITSITYRSKQKILLLNPFKNQFIIYNLQNQIQIQDKISNIINIQQIQQKSWLMSNKISYFKIIINNQQQQKQYLFGVKNIKIYQKWIKNFNIAIQYNQYSFFIKNIPSNQQIIEILNDQTNQIIYHKRKIDLQNQSPKKNISIMNLKSQQEISSKKSHQFKKTQEGVSSVSSQDNDQLRQSQIILGSVLQPKNHLSLTAPTKITYQSSSPQKSSSSIQQQTDYSQYKFRKNSQQKIEIISQFKMQQKIKIHYNDFIIQRQLGSGAFGTVYLAKFKKNDKLYALKVLNKKKLISKKHLKYAVGQANILKKMNSPFIVKLYYSFQTPINLYMVLDNCSSGDLSQLIIQRQKLSQNTSRFIIAQLILAIQYLHQHKILYRDLKPQNILIANDGYIKLTDFGLSRQNSFSMSFCGSPAYLSPEMLQKKGVGFSSDIYGIGCVLYQMMVGEPPYYDETLDTLLDNIRTGKLRYASHLSIESKSLISKLLQRDINKRLGVKDINDIKKHDFFKKIDWNLLSNKKLKPPKQMLQRQQLQNNFYQINLQSKQQIKLIDYDYNQNTSMLNRIKNFTFIREDQFKSKNNLQNTI